MRDGSPDGPLPLLTNPQVILVSCRAVQLTLVVDVADVQADVLLAGLEQLGHPLLRQPDGVSVEANVELEPPLSVRIDDYLTAWLLDLAHGLMLGRPTDSPPRGGPSRESYRALDGIARPPRARRRRQGFELVHHQLDRCGLLAFQVLPGEHDDALEVDHWVWHSASTSSWSTPLPQNWVAVGCSRLLHR